MRRPLFFVILVCLGVFTACAHKPTLTLGPTAPTRSFVWPTTAPSARGLDEQLITSLITQIQSGTYRNIHSVLIVRDGSLIVEEYFPRGADRDPRQQAVMRVSPHQLFSATKSVTALLVGIAIDRGMIAGIDAKVASFFPEYADVFARDARDQLTIRDLITMTAGIAWDEWSASYSDPRNDTVQMLLADDPLRYLLSRPVVAPRASTFTYNSGISVLLGEIVHRASGLRVDQFAQRYLFEPLSITDYYWSRLPNELAETSGGLFLRTRDMAKLGQLVLDGGRWQGRQIVSEAWLNASIVNAINPGQIPSWVQADGYGYHWWLATFTVDGRTLRSISARGRAGQFIFIFPDLHLVAAFTSLNDGPLMNQPLDMLRRYVLPAVLGAPVLPTTSAPAKRE